MLTVIQAVETQVFANRCGDNLLNKNLTFNAPFSATVVSGSGFGNATTDIAYAGQRSLYIKNLSAVSTLVLSGGGTNWFNDFQGTYVSGVNSVFQFSIYNMSGPTVTGRFRIFSEGFELYVVEFTCVPHPTNGWQTFYAVMPFYPEYDFIFELDSLGLGGTEIYLDGIKLEIDDKFNNDPTPYTTYFEREISVVQVIDVPNIADATTAIVTATLTGALVGDYVQMLVPITLINAGLEVGFPVVTAANTIKFTIRNNTGVAVDPASANYTFKILR